MVLRELDGSAGWRLSVPFVAALGQWRDRLASLIAQQWRPHGPWVVATAELAQQGLGAVSGPDVLNLCTADQPHAGVLHTHLAQNASNNILTNILSLNRL